MFYLLNEDTESWEFSCTGNNYSGADLDVFSVSENLVSSLILIALIVVLFIHLLFPPFSFFFIFGKSNLQN